METKQRARQQLDDVDWLGTDREQPVERAVVREAEHLHRPLHDLAGGAGVEAMRLGIDEVSPIDESHDRHHAEVDLRREPRVDAHLLVAEVLAPLDAELFDESEVDGLFAL